MPRSPQADLPPDESHHRFDSDTSLQVVETSDSADGAVRVFDTRIDRGWWIVAGPNGGYLNAILLRSMMRSVADPKRAPRTQTTHFTARAKEGPARVVTRIERSGRSLTTVSARLEQDGRLIALSLCALALDRGGAPTFQDTRMPVVLSPDRVAPRAEAIETTSEFRSRYEQRPIFDVETRDPDSDAISGGWIRPCPPRAGDALLISSLADAWMPALFLKVPPSPESRGVPTIELTVHFRAPEVVSRVGPGDFYLVRFSTRTLRDGFLEEDGAIWSEQGVLLAQSRQLAIFA